MFRSFFMGGYECADHINRSGVRVNLLEETQHISKAYEDYALLSETGIKTVREGIAWSQVEKKPFIYDFSEVRTRIEAAARFGIQVIWDLCHFGYPDDLIPTHPLFPKRFKSLCRAFCEFHNKYSKETLYIIPVNEISFLSWHSGDVRGTVPFAINSGFDIKYHLCKAVIEGIKTLKETDPSARILTVEPIVKILPGSCDDAGILRQVNEDQFQAMDIIGGRICPELGGEPEYLDILGFNYYYNNQWEHNGMQLAWPDPDKKRISLSDLLKEAYTRYNRPMFIAETGHFGNLRAQWLEEVTNESILAIKQGVDLRGICIYPLVDRPDWDDLNYYSECGLWDLGKNKERILNEPYFEKLKALRKKVNSELFAAGA
jgi:beta-glucosidase/6-phospho-beta-glucosidase/beta-galactosidase